MNTLAILLVVLVPHGLAWAEPPRWGRAPETQPHPYDSETQAHKRHPAVLLPPPAQIQQAPVATQTQARGATDCQEQWARYEASRACFAAYRNTNGTIKAQAYSRCTELPQPELCGD